MAVAPEAEVERRRREDQRAKGAERGRVWGGGVPLPTGGEVWEWGCAPSAENFFRFWSSKRRVLVHLWCYFLQLINLNLYIQIAKTFI